MSAGSHGSSPRAWGRHTTAVFFWVTGRFIPTRVGQTLYRVQSPGKFAVHPHARGADARNPLAPPSPGGSSPRAWGRRRRLCRWLWRYRFIPTRVGQTPFAVKASGVGLVHPHARGADHSALHAVAANNGSSPRAWGRLFESKVFDRLHRFIPTRVGQTKPGFLLKSLAFGSSPRAWGRPQEELWT